MFLVCLSATVYAQEASKNVLLLNSYHPGYLWTDEITRGVQQALSVADVDLHVDYMDTKRQFGSTYQKLLAQTLHLKHTLHKYDVVIVSDDNAFDFVRRNRRQIFGATPVVFCGINYLAQKHLKGMRNITGVNERADIDANINLIEDLHPGSRKIVVITDNTTTGKRVQEEVRMIRAVRNEQDPALQLAYDLSVDELKEFLRELGPENVVLFTFFFRDRNDVFLEYDEGATLVEKYADAIPVYGVWNFSFGYGIVGGYLVTGFDQGIEAGHKALAILNGVDPEDIPILYDTPTRLRFDFRELQEHGIELSRLPPGADIFFKPVSYYEQNKKLIWTTATVFVLLITAMLGFGYGFIRSRQAERKIQDFKKAMDSSSDAIGMATPEGKQFYRNKRFDELFGDVGEDPATTLYVDKKVGQEVFQTIKEGKDWSGEVAVHGKNNEILDVFLRAYPVKREGKVVALVGVHTDLTEQKKSEAELQKMDKLKGIGTLAGGIAHDFNNILTALFGNISIARSSLGRDHPASGPLAEAEKSMNRAIRLTKQLLTFSKGGDPVKEDASLGLLVQEIVRFDLSGSNVKPVFDLADDLWMAEVDKGQMQQVFSNLAINADQAMPVGGHLYVTLENSEISESAVPNLKPGKYVRITMRDEGIGIDRKHLKRIFDPYYSTKQTGSGLGLATVYSIVVKHGGHIRADSEPGKGTVFTLYLPASESEPVPEAPPPEPYCTSPEQTCRILVMDDEEMIRKVASVMLETCGYEVDTAPDGKTAVEKYRQSMVSGQPFDLVIMDLTVPGGMGGVEAVRELLAIDPQAKALVSSGYASDPVLANYVDYGFKGIVAKPYAIDQLKDAVNRILEEQGTASPAV